MTPAGNATAEAADAGVPIGFRIRLDRNARELRPGLWFGGQPTRILRLTPVAIEALEALRTAPVAGRVQATVARRLTDAGIAHPAPPRLDGPADVTVVVPVRDRADALDRCLFSLGRRYPVVVVDDGSADELAVRAVAHRHGAHVVRHEVNAGPAAARETGLTRVTTGLVAFVDSDTEPGSDWIAALAAHLADPGVAAAAPRVTPRAADTWAGRYTRARGTLDLGPAPGRVVPYTRVSYVPTAALVARRSALDAVARDGHVFDPALRVGEDVDLVWRLTAAGHRVRYVPSTTVAHVEPSTWRALLARRFRYGTSAAPLSARHPDNIAPLIVHPWYTSAVLALLARRPLVAAAATAVAAEQLRRSLTRADVPTDGLTRATVGAVGQTFLGTARYAVQFTSPLLVAALVRGGAGTRLAAAALLFTPPLAAWRGRRAGIDPVRFTVGALADDIAYGAGVVAGCVQHRTTVPLRPTRAR